MANPGANVDPQVVEAFGEEWQRFDQRAMSEAEALALFQCYFEIFPWAELRMDAQGFDAGCGSGRWARFVAPRVGFLHCVDASAMALRTASVALAGHTNCKLHLAAVDSMPFPDGSMDFGYSLGVLHHIPNTESALRACVRKLKPGAPFLLFLYYRFDNRPFWFRAIWRVSDAIRRLVSRTPFRLRSLASDALAVTLYWPLARVARMAERAGLGVDHFPLSGYRNHSFYVMRTDALDRFGTRLEKRFTRAEILRLMEMCGLGDVRFHEGWPYWVAVGTALTPVANEADASEIPGARGDTSR